uniref:Large ribosomal subunit protein uL5c n=1 Tax=Lambia antarctica TaxID=101717 RepID=A0A1L2EDY7_9CHLO|nr:50S ribosomal protein L5 [Lambia antarctica]ANN39076.1 50S ribosomal protein L5 [Lambia antarctica]
MSPRFKEYYINKVSNNLLKNEELDYKNFYQIPKIKKIIINRGIGDASQNPRILETSHKNIVGQKSIITKSKKSISGFKLRQKMPVGVSVTLRNQFMYNFLDRLLNLALPRIRDFQGLSLKSFDGSGNYSLGLEEQLMFPEINYDQIDQLRGMDITIVTSAKTDKESFLLLKELGFPFQKTEFTTKI